jgi:glycine/D-amino acid oxidase-like deaminating enzyme
MNFSIWEHNYYQTDKAIVVLGAGFTGFSTAISILDENPKANVILVDKNFPSLGASTKNAGFACYGSVTEILDDLKSMDEAACISLIKMRKKGIAKHLERVSKKDIHYKKEGGFEMFDADIDVNNIDIKLCNDLMKQAWNKKDYFKLKRQKEFSSFNDLTIVAKQEASLNPMKLYMSLYKLALKKGAKFIFGKEITSIDFDNKKLISSTDETLSFDKLCICVNGFVSKIINIRNVKIVRNQVVVTSKLNNLDLKGVYHYDCGYYYFRRVGNRILLGGARNKDAETETTDQFGNTEKIVNILKEFMHDKILGHDNFTIDYQWSGLLGVGEDKNPIIEKYNDDVYLGVKLGGMGVALSGFIGDRLAKMALDL